MAIPKIIHRSTPNLTWEEKRFIARAKKLMPDFEHILWSDQDNIELIQKHLPRNLEDYLTFPTGVIRVDVARCLYMYEFGGIYVDTDYIFYKALDEEFLSKKCVLGIEEEENKMVGGGYKVGNAFLASEPSFQLWPEFIESIFYRYRRGERQIVTLSGPHALTKFIKAHPEYENQITLMGPSVIYPDFRWFKTKTHRHSNTIGGHLCWGSWRNKSFLQAIRSRGRRVISAML